MTNFDNNLVRGSSPSYSEDLTSVNGMSTLPIGARNGSRKSYKSSGYERIAQKISMKNRNTFTFWTLIALLFILTIGNLLLTITIIGVLRLGKGMQSIEIIPEEDTIKFFGTIDLDRIYKRDGNIEGFTDEPVTIESEESDVFINVNRHGTLQSRLALDSSGISLKGINTFELRHPTTGEIIFSTHRPRYVLPQGAQSLYAKGISTSRIVSPIDRDLKLSSDNKVSVRGSEGVFVESSAINITIMSSNKNIVANSSQGTTIFSSNKGFFMTEIPKVDPGNGIRTGNIQYKICVCMPQGKLFRIPIPRNHSGKITCTHFNAKHDPCL